MIFLWLVPDKIFEKIDAITPDVLRAEGVRGLILDIDYTLAPKTVPLPDETVRRFIENLKTAGILLYIISNNNNNRVSRFASALDLPFICNGLKPFPRSFLKAVREMKLSRGEVAVVGDQIYTDMAGAHAAGLRGWLVAPYGVSKSLFYKLRRKLEQPFIRRFYKSNPPLPQNAEAGSAKEETP